jgi:hypothetical protein
LTAARFDLSQFRLAGLANDTVKVLLAGLEVMKRKRVGRIWDLSPEQSVSALGITVAP